MEAKPIRLITRVMSSDAFVSSDNNKMDVVLSGQNFPAKVKRTVAPRLNRD